MNIRRIAAAEIDEGLALAWHGLRASNPALHSPYFTPEFIQAASAACAGVQVGVIERDGRIQGFFPFQLKSRRIGGPVGGQLSDWHGVISEPDAPCDMKTLMKGCGLDIWDFDHVPASQGAFAPFVKASASSPVLDLQEGFDAYLERRKAAGAQRLAQTQRKARGFERKVGPLRFEVDSRDRRAFGQLLQWKQEQCLRTGVPDFLSWGWTTALIERIWATETPALAGRLSVVWHEDTVVAAHFGMRGDNTWHWWFPTYNKAFAEYSPGGILLLMQAEAAAAAGMHRLDLGKGDDLYKQSFATAALPLVEGSVLMPSMASTWRRSKLAGLAWIHASPTLNRAWEAVRPLRDRLQSRSNNAAAARP